MAQWLTDYELADMVGEDWLEVDLSHSGYNMAQSDEAMEALLDSANEWLSDAGVYVSDVRDSEDYLEWLVA
jgi:hypothetical protein